MLPLSRCPESHYIRPVTEAAIRIDNLQKTYAAKGSPPKPRAIRTWADACRNSSTANSEHIPLINQIGFGAALALLLGNMWIMTARRRFSRG